MATCKMKESLFALSQDFREREMVGVEEAVHKDKNLAWIMFLCIV